MSYHTYQLQRNQSVRPTLHKFNLFDADDDLDAKLRRIAIRHLRKLSNK